MMVIDRLVGRFVGWLFVIVLFYEFDSELDRRSLVEIRIIWECYCKSMQVGFHM